MLSRILNKCSNIYYFNFLLHIPPKYQGIVDWVRIIFWDYPKFVLLPLITIRKNWYVSSKKPKQKYYISYAQTNEGIGGQLYRYSTALILADLFHLTYVHNPFVFGPHSPSQNWQKFLGFSKNSLEYKSIRQRRKITICYLPKFDLRHSKDLQLNLLKSIIQINKNSGDVLFLVTAFSFYPLNEYKRWSLLLGKMREEYNNARKSFPVLGFNKKNVINIAVHIRRGDIVDYYRKRSIQGYGRWVETYWYSQVLNKLISIYETNIAIKIFSNANSNSELSGLEHLPHTRIYLAKDSKNSASDAFHSIVTADIIVCGLSAFSYFAGSISNGVKIVPPSKIELSYFPKKKTSGWIFPDEKGYFDSNEIKKYLPQNKKYKHK